MNYYERIQTSIDYIEENLKANIDLLDVSREAFMSNSNFYRLFYSMVGLGVKEYIRLRRISCACNELRSTSKRIIDLAFEYQFKSQEAFTRSFKMIVGTTPGLYRKDNRMFQYERVDLMDKYFEIQDGKLLEAYPEIKVLKEMKPRKVAYFVAVSESPEEDALKVILKWGKEKHLIGENGTSRIFGFNNPNPTEGTSIYGYEYQIIVDDNFISDNEHIKTKYMDGGFYAVMSTNVSEIGKAWQRFVTWIEISKYEHGNHQWMEEHLTLEGDFKIDLYMPIIES